MHFKKKNKNDNDQFDGIQQEQQEEKRRPERLKIKTYHSINSLKTAKDYFFQNMKPLPVS